MNPTQEHIRSVTEAYLKTSLDAKDSVMNRLTLLGESIEPAIDDSEAHSAALIATLTLVGEQEKVSATVSDRLKRIAEQLVRKGLDSTEIRETAANSAYQRGLYHMLIAYDPQTNTNDAAQVTIARRYITAANKIGSNHAMYESSLAQLDLSSADYEGAYRHASAAVQAEPTNGEALRMKGLAAWSLDRNDEAEELMNASLRVAPNLSDTRENLIAIQVDRARQEGRDPAEVLARHGITTQAPIARDVAEWFWKPFKTGKWWIIILFAAGFVWLGSSSREGAHGSATAWIIAGWILYAAIYGAGSLLTIVALRQDPARRAALGAVPTPNEAERPTAPSQRGALVGIIALVVVLGYLAFVFWPTGT